jgi:hypothetical protein
MVLSMVLYWVGLAAVTVAWLVELLNRREADKFGQWASQERDREKARADLLAVRLEKALCELGNRGVAGRDRV